MSAVELIHRASVAGLEMTVSQDGCLQLRADHPPSDNLLVELAAHKIEIINALNAANDSMLSSAWLSRVARLLDTRVVRVLVIGMV